jgi:hypothetical protein
MALRDKSIPEPVHPICAQACAWCEKDEMYIPLQDCMDCKYNYSVGNINMTIYCNWVPKEILNSRRCKNGSG